MIDNNQGFINNPETIEEFKHNAQFQLDCVSGWMIVNDYECALIKAKCLIEALEKLVEQTQTKK
ncbi:MAG: hypothetical protein EBR82_17505 [Caulobacteraceae bacterium]|nr:hypothetical protein [Caulobacteraceae bacterium]